MRWTSALKLPAVSSWTTVGLVTSAAWAFHAAMIGSAAAASAAAITNGPPR